MGKSVMKLLPFFSTGSYLTGLKILWSDLGGTVLTAVSPDGVSCNGEQSKLGVRIDGVVANKVRDGLQLRDPFLPATPSKAEVCYGGA